MPVSLWKWLYMTHLLLITFLCPWTLTFHPVLLFPSSLRTLETKMTIFPSFYLLEMEAGSFINRTCTSRLKKVHLWWEKVLVFYLLILLGLEPVVSFNQYSAWKREQVRSGEGEGGGGRGLDKTFWWKENEAYWSSCWVGRCWQSHVLKYGSGMDGVWKCSFGLCLQGRDTLDWNEVWHKQIYRSLGIKQLLQEAGNTSPVDKTKAIAEKQYLFPTFLLNYWILPVAGGKTLNLTYKWCNLVREILLVNLTLYWSTTKPHKNKLFYRKKWEKVCCSSGSCIISRK